MFKKFHYLSLLFLAAFAHPAAAAWKAETYNQGSAYPLCDNKDSLSEFSGALNNGDAELQAHMVNSGNCTLVNEKLSVEVISQSMFGGWSKVILMGKKWEGMPPVYTVVEAVHRVKNDSIKPATPPKDESTSPAVKGSNGDSYTDAEKSIIG